MLKLFTIMFFIFVMVRGPNSEYGNFRRRYFDKPSRYLASVEMRTAGKWQHRHIHNMTANIIKDALYKLRHADVVQTKYKHTHGYELGLIAAGIMDHYRHMIIVYRYYSKAIIFKNRTHDVQQIMNAYSVIQSDYNEMLHETVLFYKVLDHHLKKQKADRLRAYKLSRKYKMSQELMLEMIKAGVDVEGILEGGKDNNPFKPPPSGPPTERRRFYQGKGKFNNTLIGIDPLDLEDAVFANSMMFGDMEGFPKEKSINEWVKKNENNTKEAEYKKSLRYKMWAEKWDGFNPDVEGVKIPDKLASMGLKNASDFFMEKLNNDFI